MSLIQTQSAIFHLTSGLNVTSTCQRDSNESGFVSNTYDVTTVEQSVSIGSLITPRQMFFKLVSGDDLLVGLSSGNYPFRLSMSNGDGEPLLLRFNVESLRQIDEITVPADVAGNLGGKYFILDDRNADAVWVWFNTGAGAGEFATATLTSDNTNVSNDDTVTIGNKTYTFKTALTPTEGEVLIGADADGSLLNLIRAVNHTGTPDTDYKCAAAHTQVSAAASVTDHAFEITALVAGSAANAYDTTTTAATLSFGGSDMSGGIDPCVAPTPSSSRLIEVTIAVGDTAPTVATAVATALDADAEFISTANGAVVTVTDQHVGTRTGANANSISGLSVADPNPQDGANPPTVYLKSKGTSQVVVAVAPN